MTRNRRDNELLIEYYKRKIMNDLNLWSFDEPRHKMTIEEIENDILATYGDAGIFTNWKYYYEQFRRRDD